MKSRTLHTASLSPGRISNSRMSYEDALLHYFKWAEERAISPTQPSKDLSAYFDGKWYLENDDGVFASVDQHGDIWQGDNPYLTMEEFRALCLKQGLHAFKKPPSATKANPTIATGTDDYGTLFVRMTQGDQSCELTLPELKEILQAVADAKKTPPGKTNIFESSTARLDALGKYVRRTVKVWLGKGKVNFDVGESGLDEIKDTSVILPATIGQITSGVVTVEEAFLKSVVKAVGKRK